MNKTLIAFYSRSGHTRQVAHAISRRCGAHLEDIQLPDDRLGWRGYARSVLDSLTRRAPPLGPLEHDVAEYDIVVVGTPIWAFHPSSPIRSYLTQTRGSIRNIAFFCTMGGSGADRVFNELRALVGRVPVATLALTQAEIDANQYASKVAWFTDRLGASAPASEQPLGRRPSLRTVK